MPLFSTVMPTYDAAVYLGTAIDSVLAQTFQDNELIVVDDGSSDGTESVLKRYEGRIRVLRQANSGPGAARNLGIKEATGKYIAFLDSDDVWMPWTLETYVAALERSPEAVFMAGHTVEFQEGQALPSIGREPLELQVYNDYLAASSQAIWVIPGAAAVRADVLKCVGGFHCGWANGEDSALWLQLGCAGVFVKIASPTTLGYRRRAESASMDGGRTIEGIKRIVEEELADCYPGGMERRRERMEIVTRHVRPASLACLREGRIAEAWQLYRRTLGWHIKLQRGRYLLGFLLCYARARVRQMRRRDTSR